MSVITAEDSPFKVIRKKCGFSQRSFAALCNQSITTIIYIEAGLYERNPERASRILLAKAEDREIDLQAFFATYDNAHSLDEATVAYQKWFRQRNQQPLRRAFQVLFVDHPVSELEGNEDSPMTRIAHRMALPGRDTLAKQLKIPPVVMRQFETGDTRKMPQVLHTALLDSGLLDAEVAQVEAAQQGWVMQQAGMLALVD